MAQAAPEKPAPRIPSFWTFQLGGWLLYSLAVAAALIPFREMRGDIAYRSAFLLAGFAASFLMYALCRALWRRRMGFFRALIVCLLASYLLGIIISAASIWAEIHLGGLKMAFRLVYAFAGGTGASFVLIAWSAFYFGIKHYGSLEEQKLRLLASESLAREAQLRALRYQLQPHFLFNTLNAISTLVLDNQPRAATQMIARLAGLLRSTLDAPDTHQVSLEEELAVTEEYLAIEKVRFGSRLAVSFEIAPEARTARVPRLLLQPLVENAVRHGIAKRPEGGTIVLRADVSEASLRMQITNEGYGKEIGEGSHAGEQGQRLGLANTLARLEQLYGPEATLRTAETPGGDFTVTITFPLDFTESAISNGRALSLKS